MKIYLFRAIEVSYDTKQVVNDETWLFSTSEKLDEFYERWAHRAAQIGGDWFDHNGREAFITDEGNTRVEFWTEEQIVDEGYL